MEDFSLYQWLVIGLLSWIAFCATAIGWYSDSNLEAVTQRLERALESVQQEVENTSAEIRVVSQFEI